LSTSNKKISIVYIKFNLTNVVALIVDDAGEKAVVVNICAPPSASRKIRNVSL
jgi:hypothetical protein